MLPRVWVMPLWLLIGPYDIMAIYVFSAVPWEDSSLCCNLANGFLSSEALANFTSWACCPVLDSCFNKSILGDVASLPG